MPQHLNIELLPSMMQTAFKTAELRACAREGYRAAKHFQLTNEGTCHGYALNSSELNAFRIGETIYNVQHATTRQHKDADCISPAYFNHIREALGQSKIFAD